MNPAWRGPFELTSWGDACFALGGWVAGQYPLYGRLEQTVNVSGLAAAIDRGTQAFYFGSGRPLPGHVVAVPEGPLFCFLFTSAVIARASEPLQSPFLPLWTGAVRDEFHSLSPFPPGSTMPVHRLGPSPPLESCALTPRLQMGPRRRVQTWADDEVQPDAARVVVVYADAADWGRQGPPPRQMDVQLCLET